MGRTAGVHPQGPGEPMGPRRGIGAKGARKASGQAAIAVDVEAGVARQVQGALASPKLAGARTIPIMAPLVAVLAATSGTVRLP